MAVNMKDALRLEDEYNARCESELEINKARLEKLNQHQETKHLIPTEHPPEEKLPRMITKKKWVSHGTWGEWIEVDTIYKCICGSEVGVRSKARHFKTQKHLHFVRVFCT